MLFATDAHPERIMSRNYRAPEVWPSERIFSGPKERPDYGILFVRGPSNGDDWGFWGNLILGPQA